MAVLAQAIEASGGDPDWTFWLVPAAILTASVVSTAVFLVTWRSKRFDDRIKYMTAPALEYAYRVADQMIGIHERQQNATAKLRTEVAVLENELRHLRRGSAEGEEAS